MPFVAFVCAFSHGMVYSRHESEADFMNDNIRVSSEWLNNCAGWLTEVENAVNGATGILSSTDTSERSGGQVHLSLHLNMARTAYIAGDNIAALIASVNRVMSETEHVIAELGSSCRKAASAFDNAESANEKAIGSIGTGSAPDTGKGISFKAWYHPVVDPIWNNTNDMLHDYKKTWESRDRFIETQYNKDMMDRLREAIYTNPYFSKTSWEACTDRAQKEKFIRDLIKVINEDIYYVDLTDGVCFVYDEDFDQNGFATVTTEKGETLTGYPESADGGYTTFNNGSRDVIILKNIDIKDYDDVINTLCHESRHNMQQEIMDSDEDKLDKYAEQGSEDYQHVIDSRKEWLYNDSDYKQVDQDSIDAKKEEYEAGASKGQKNNPNYENKKDWYGIVEAYRDYASQQAEVDARYAGEEAEKWVNNQEHEIERRARNEQREVIRQTYIDRTGIDPFKGIDTIQPNRSSRTTTP